jgi:hypothetical protein
MKPKTKPTLGRVIDRARQLRQRTDEQIDALINELTTVEDRDAARQVLDVDLPMPEGE